MQIYLKLIERILEEGTHKEDRTGTGVLSVFAHQMRFNLAEGFPLVTTKTLHLKSLMHELLWFLNGDTNIAYLNQNGVSIWNSWANASGDLGPIYGHQWRSWTTREGETIDQLSNLIHDIKTNPTSRRLLVSAWNVGDLKHMALPPCHLLFQFYIANKTLSCQLYQRSADVFLGVPFNIASYALLTHMVAQQCDLAIGEFIWTGGDCHLYTNHLTQAKTQLTRSPLPLPHLEIQRKPKSLFEYQFDDFKIINYQSHPSIKAPIAV